LSSLFVPTIA